MIPRVAEPESRATAARPAPFLVVAMLALVALCFAWQALAAPVLQAALPVAAFWAVQCVALLVATATAVAFARHAGQSGAGTGLAGMPRERDGGRRRHQQCHALDRPECRHRQGRLQDRGCQRLPGEAQGHQRQHRDHEERRGPRSGCAGFGFGHAGDHAASLPPGR